MSHHIYLKRYASVYENFEFPYYKLKERKGRHRNNICTFHVVPKSCNIFFVFSTNFLYKKASPIHADMDNDDACIYNPLLQMPLPSRAKTWTCMFFEKKSTLRPRLLAVPFLCIEMRLNHT